MKPGSPGPESNRLAALRRYDVLDLELDASLDGCVRLAAHICGTPSAMISIVDETRQRSYGPLGTPVTDIPRELSFCSHAIVQTDMFEVPDALEDSRFAHNPSVSGEPYIRFYAGSPLVTPDGNALGTLCVMDTRPRALSPEQQAGLRYLARHVTDHLELRLLAAHLHMQAELLALAHDAIVVRDGEGSVLSWNQGAEEIYGWTADEVVGLNLHHLLRSAVDGRPFDNDEALLAHGSWEGVVTQKTKRGSSRLIHTRSVLKRDRQGHPRAVLEINSDITAQKRSEAERDRLMDLLQEQNLRLRELDQVKDEFVASISHEVRTPLASMRSHLEFLLDGDAGQLNDQQRKFLTVIDRSSQRVLRLVNDLLLLASHNVGGAVLESSAVDLAVIAAECIEGQAPIADEQKLDVSLACTGQTLVRGDPAKLAEVIDNLLSNALKYTPAGGSVQIRVAGDSDSVFLEVEDTGTGIPPEEQRRVFERFYRGSAAVERAVPGTGLGLAVCNAIVQAHRGSIGLRDNNGNGSNFWVMLPAAKGD